MHIILAVLGLIGAGAFWWYRLKVMSDAANEVVDTVGRVRGSMRRRKIRRQNTLSPVTAIDDPVVAAATLIVAITAEDMAVLPEHDEKLRAGLKQIAAPAQVEEAAIYAEWAATQIDDAVVVIDKLAPMLRERLDEHEKLELLDLVRGATVETATPPLFAERLRRLTQKLGLPVN